MTNTAKTITPAQKQALLEIAQQHFFVETLAEQKSDSLDFHTVSVWGMERALEAAFRAGQAAGKGARS